LIDKEAFFIKQADNSPIYRTIAPFISEYKMNEQFDKMNINSNSKFTMSPQE